MADRFLSPHARQGRMQKALDWHGWTWYHLAQLMDRNLNSIQKSFYACNEGSYNPNLETLKLAATALGVSIGFLTDKKPTKCPHCGRRL